jgi:hypothetical protein
VLIVQMPDKEKKKDRRRGLRALGYLLAGALIVTSGLLTVGSNWWYLTAAIEAWWLWAVITGLK